MSKLRKGSIAWDVPNQRKCKILTKPNSGEVPDNMFKATGRKYSSLLNEYVLIVPDNFEPIPGRTLYHNNAPCVLAKLFNLVPYKRYLVTLN